MDVAVEQVEELETLVTALERPEAAALHSVEQKAEQESSEWVNAYDAFDIVDGDFHPDMGEYSADLISLKDNSFLVTPEDAEPNRVVDIQLTDRGQEYLDAVGTVARSIGASFLYTAGETEILRDGGLRTLAAYDSEFSKHELYGSVRDFDEPVDVRGTTHKLEEEGFLEFELTDDMFHIYSPTPKGQTWLNLVYSSDS